MVFTIGTLFEAGLLLVNAIAILNEERFLKKGCYICLYGRWFSVILINAHLCFSLNFQLVGEGIIKMLVLITGQE